MKTFLKTTRVLWPAFIIALAMASTTEAATGDHVATLNFSQNCTSGLGVGIAYDGTNFWYSCYGFGANVTDLYKADSGGNVIASYDIVPTGGLGALSYDATRNVIWAGEGGGVPGVEPVYRIDLDAGKNVTGSSIAFNVSVLCGLGFDIDLDDGLAFDARNAADPSDDVIYYSNDCLTTVIRVFNLTGSQVENFTWAGDACYNSGLAVGGELLYEGSDGCSKVWAVNKTDKALQFNFSTIVAGDPNFRDEDLECDTNTFASQGKHVMWSKEAYSPARAHAFEIPFGSCGIGGQRVPPNASCIETVNPAGKNIPPAGKTTLPGPKGGQNEDGFYRLLAQDLIDPNPAAFIKDTGSGAVFGPFANGTNIKYTEANGAVPSQKPIGGPNSAVAWHIIGTGDAAVYAVNNAGVKSKEVLCLVPPPPK